MGGVLVYFMPQKTPVLARALLLALPVLVAVLVIQAVLVP
jgi:hypothetical protein